MAANITGMRCFGIRKNASELERDAKLERLQEDKMERDTKLEQLQKDLMSKVEENTRLKKKLQRELNNHGQFDAYHLQVLAQFLNFIMTLFCHCSNQI